MHVCLQADPSCSGLFPCQFCWDTIMVRVLPRAMVLTDQASGQVIFTHPQLGELFLSAWKQAWQDIQLEAQPHLKATAPQPTLNAEEQSAPATAEEKRAEAQAEPVKLADGTELHEVEEQEVGDGYEIDPDRLKKYVDKLNRDRTAATQQTEQTLEAVKTAELAESVNGERKTPNGAVVESTASSAPVNEENPPSGSNEGTESQKEA